MAMTALEQVGYRSNLRCSADSLTPPPKSVQLEPHLYLSPRRSVAVSQAGERKIHIRVEGELHRLLRIRCAELDLTIQDYVVHLLEENLRGRSKTRGRAGGAGTHGRVDDKGKGRQGAT